VQQIIVVDYKVMQNSPAAMQLKDRVLPPELKRLESALKTSGLKVDQDADTLAFAAFRDSGGTGTRILGVAQGQFQTAAILANFAKNKTKPMMYRQNSIYPMGNAGMSVAFLNQTTMVFGDLAAVKAALDARDGLQPNFLQNGEMMNDMTSVDSRAVWSLLDQKGTQTMMKSVLGEAAQLADYDTVKKRELHDGFLQRREVQHVGGDLGLDHRGDGGDADEGCGHPEEDLGLAAGEDRDGRYHHRLQRRHADGGVLVLGQRVCGAA